MFPADSIILLVQADHVFADRGCSVYFGQYSIKVLDNSQAIAAQCEVICGTPGTCVAKVECLLAVERGSWISIRDRHLTQGESVENAAPIISHVMEHGSFSWSEAKAKSPLLPLYQVSVNLE